MADAVLPETVFTPAVAMVGADQNRAFAETGQQPRELLIHPLQTSPLTASAFNGITSLSTEGNAGAGPLRPGGTLVPIGNVGLADIEEEEDRLLGWGDQ